MRKQFCDFRRGPHIRQRHLATSRHRIEALRNKNDETYTVFQTTRHPPGIGACAEIDVGARRAHDRGAGVLRHHQPPERRLRLLRLDRQFAFDKEQRAVDMQRLVDGDRPSRRQRDALRADRFILVGKLHFAKEHIGPVLPPQFLGAVGILIHPFPDPLHRHLIFRDDVALDQDAADRRIGVAIMCVVIDADGRAVLEADPRRALDLREQQIGLVFEPADFEASAGDRTVFDLAAIVIGYELAAADLAKHLSLVGQTNGVLFEAADKQVRGTAINRHGVDVGLGPGPVDHGLVVAGDKTLAFAKPRDAQGEKMLLEECPRFGAVGNIKSSGRAAGIA